MAHIVYAEGFAHDLAKDVGCLRRIQEPGWIRTLAEDLAELEALRMRFPQAGSEHARRGTGLLRLFHTRQRTPEIRFPSSSLSRRRTSARSAFFASGRYRNANASSRVHQRYWSCS